MPTGAVAILATAYLLGEHWPETGGDRPMQLVRLTVHSGLDGLIRTVVRGLQPARDATGKRFFLAEPCLPVTKPEQSAKVVQCE